MVNTQTKTQSNTRNSSMQKLSNVCKVWQEVHLLGRQNHVARLHLLMGKFKMVLSILSGNWYVGSLVQIIWIRMSTISHRYLVESWILSYSLKDPTTVTSCSGTESFIYSCWASATTAFLVESRCEQASVIFGGKFQVNTQRHLSLNCGSILRQPISAHQISPRPFATGNAG